METYMKLLEDNSKLVTIKSIVQNYLGITETEMIWKNAELKLKSIISRYENIPKKEQKHTDLIFPHIALYKALMEKHADVAMEIMERGEAEAAKKSAKSLQKFVKFPLGKTIFIKGFAAGCKTGFGIEAGFKNTVYQADHKIYQMDITSCPYEKYCNAEECNELTHIFCDNDVYAYGSLQGITFTRHQTLGEGGEKCDFLIKKI